ncbi:MAG TPA: rod shape-determining protein MreD [Thermoanaerobaculia bacterium]|nr:rod shape-determining protein MreD [Thermoanaerobaculia bacterium]
MRAARFLAGLLLVLLFHSLGVAVMPEFGRAVDLFLVLTVLVALRGRTLDGMLAGLVAGLSHDVLTSSLFGLHGFADTLLGYGTARLVQRVVVERASGLLLVGFAASVVQQALLACLVLLLQPQLALPDPLWIGLRALITGVLTVVLWSTGRAWRSGSRSRQQSRGRRLRLD